MTTRYTLIAAVTWTLIGTFIYSKVQANPINSIDPLSEMQSNHSSKMAELQKSASSIHHEGSSSVGQVRLTKEKGGSLVAKAAAKKKKLQSRFRRGIRGYTASHPDDFKDICGKQGISRVPRIMKGNCTQYGELPWMAQIQIRSQGSDSKYEHYCGGTIISDVLILTAAHCFETFEHTFMRVVVGQHNLDVKDTDEQEFAIEKFVRHSNWQSADEPKHSNDIAMVKLRRKENGKGISFSEAVVPACLPEPTTVFTESTHCVVSGWGKSTEQEVKKECLEAATIPIISNEECEQMYPAVGNSKRIGRGMTCAGFRNGEVDACGGDSGGPLACNIDGRFNIFGVVSWGEGCGQKAKPGVYSKVQHYLEWIKRVSQEIR